MAKYLSSEESDEDSSAQARKRHSKNLIVMNSEVIERAQALILENLSQSLRSLAKIIGVIEPTMRIITEEHIRYNYYTLKGRHMLSDSDRKI